MVHEFMRLALPWCPISWQWRRLIRNGTLAEGEDSGGQLLYVSHFGRAATFLGALWSFSSVSEKGGDSGAAVRLGLRSIARRWVVPESLSCSSVCERKVVFWSAGLAKAKDTFEIGCLK